MDIWVPVIVALITSIGSFLGVYYANRKAAKDSAALLDYRLTQLEEKVDRHNQIIDRTYRCEEQIALQEAEIRRLGKRIELVEERRIS